MRLTIAHREAIINAAILKTFSKRDAKYTASRTALADAIYESEYGKDGRIAMKLPEHWRHMHKSFNIKCDGFFYGKHNCSYEIVLSKERPFPSCHVEVKVPPAHACYKQAQDVTAMYRDIAKGKEELRNELTTLLWSCTTVKRLKEAWPEGKAYFPKEVAPAMQLPVPFGLTKKINSMLGLSA